MYRQFTKTQVSILAEIGFASEGIFPVIHYWMPVPGSKRNILEVSPPLSKDDSFSIRVNGSFAGSAYSFGEFLVEIGRVLQKIDDEMKRRKSSKSVNIPETSFATNLQN